MRAPPAAWLITHARSTFARGEYEIELERGEDLACATVLVVDRATAAHEPFAPAVAVLACDDSEAHAWLEAEAQEYEIGEACFCGVSRNGKASPCLQTDHAVTR